MASENNVSKVVAAEEFQLVDSKGVLRARLSTSPSDGSGHLEFYDGRHCGRISLGLDAAGNPHLGLMRADGTCAIGVGIFMTGEGGLSIFNSAGKCLFRIQIDPDENATIEAVSGENTYRWPL